jgi:tetratricopeptide (TPR) repeat protein
VLYSLVTAISVTVTELPVQPVAPKLSQPWAWCARQGGQAIDPDLRISGCTSVIQCGTETQANLAIAFNNRGIAYAAKGDNDRAIQDYDEAIRLKPDYGYAFINRGTAHSAKGDSDLGIQDFDQAIRLNPDDADAFYNRGNTYQAKVDNDRAIQDFDEAIPLKPDYAYAFHNRGIAYRAKGDNDRAIQDFDQAIRLKPDSAMAFNNRGNAYAAKGDTDQAIHDYDEAIRLKPDYASPLNGRCWARAFDNKALEVALLDCNESLPLRPGDAITLKNRAFVYFRMAQYVRRSSIAAPASSASRGPRNACTSAARETTHKHERPTRWRCGYRCSESN